MSERINSTSFLIFSVYKGKILKEIIKAIKTNLKFTHHRILACSPAKIVNGTNILGPFRRKNFVKMQSSLKDSNPKIQKIKNKLINLGFKTSSTK